MLKSGHCLHERGLGVAGNTIGLLAAVSLTMRQSVTATHEREFDIGCSNDGRQARFRLMGRDYEAVVISAGFGGTALGSTATAIANMTAVTQQYGWLVAPSSLCRWCAVFSSISSTP